MSSPVSIGNQALLMLGASPVVSFDDQTVEANALTVLYEPAKKQVLRSYDWNCANKVERLAELADPPMDKRWDHRFAFPEDCLRVLEVISIGEDQNYADVLKFTVLQKEIHTRCAPAAARYIANIEEPFLDDHVEMALVARLAVDLSYALTASNSREANLLEIAERKLMEARTTDAQERTHKKFRTDTLQIARG